MLEAILELLLELIVNLAIEGLFNGLPRAVFTWRGLRTVSILAAAGLLGWGSAAILPRPLVPWIGWRAAYVIFAPLIVAHALDWWNRRRVAAGGREGWFTDWLDAWLFAFTFSLVRLLATL